MAGCGFAVVWPAVIRWFPAGQGAGSVCFGPPRPAGGGVSFGTTGFGELWPGRLRHGSVRLGLGWRDAVRLAMPWFGRAGRDRPWLGRVGQWSGSPLLGKVVRGRARLAKLGRGKVSRAGVRHGRTRLGVAGHNVARYGSAGFCKAS